jgi:protease I
MKKAVIIIGKGFEDSEFFYPYYRLQEEGIQVDIAIAGDKEAPGKYGMLATPTMKCAQLDANQFDLVVIPGGHEGPDRARQVPEILSFVKEMDKQQKPIATICHGSWVMISADVVKGRKMTCYVGMKDDLINAGANYVDEDVVVDGHIVSSPHFRNNHQWMAALLQKNKK